MRATGHTMLYFALGCIVAGIGLAFLIVPMIEASAQSPYPISPIDPQPVLETYVEKTVAIDARDRTHWVFFDFSRGSVVKDARIDGRNWDLAFRRYRVETNSGSTHPGGIGGAIRLGKHEPSEAPEDGWVVDEWEGWGRQAVSVNPAFSRWYRYSLMASGLVSRGDWYVVKTSDGGYAKLKFLSYHCPGNLGGGHGCVTFQYGYRSDFSRKLTATSKSRSE